MKNVNIDELDIFQLSSLKEILDNRAEYYQKNIPDYALMITNAASITPVQRNMLDKYNKIKEKSARVASMIENYLLNTLFEDAKDKKSTV